MSPDELSVRLADAERRLVDREIELAQLRRALARAEDRAAELESSATFQVGRTLVAGARHPASAVVSVPKGLTRIWRSHRSRRARAPRPRERLVPIMLPPANRAGGDAGLLVLTAADRLIVPKRLAQRGLGGYEIDAIACYLAALDIAGPGAVFDIGANIGIYAAVASALTDRAVLAFEPSPELADVARRFAADNALGYLTESIALGAEDGTATLYLSDQSDSSNSLNADFRPSSAQVEVPVETVDSYVARTGSVPAVMKVDTESTEPDVLAGATKTIDAHRPWILCEVLAGRVEPRLQEVLKPLGYHWYHITDDVPYQEAEAIVGDTSYHHLMWLFAPERPSEEFWSALRERTTALGECSAARGATLWESRRRPG